MDQDTNVQQMIEEECNNLKDLLLEKNKKYGNSALEPKRIFSKLSNIEQILVRIDDKLSRIQNLGASNALITEGEDQTLDLLGYLILLRIAIKSSQKPNLKLKDPDYVTPEEYAENLIKIQRKLR